MSTRTQVGTPSAGPCRGDRRVVRSTGGHGHGGKPGAGRREMPWNGPMTPGDLLARFHTEVRLADRDAAPGFVVDRDGPVHRTYPPNPTEHGAMVECPEGLGDDPDHWVARQVALFRRRGQRAEWKTYDYD